MGEKASPHDEVLRAVEFEEEELAGLEGLEGAIGARLPEVNFFESWRFAQLDESSRW